MVKARNPGPILQEKLLQVSSNEDLGQNGDKSPPRCSIWVLKASTTSETAWGGTSANAAVASFKMLGDGAPHPEVD